MNAGTILTIDAFLRAIEVNKGLLHAIFLGAGASISSQVPSAEQCIWEWKKQIVLSTNPSLNKQLYDTSLPSIREKIQRNLDSEGHYPPLGSPKEYSFYIEACYPISEDRQRYFQGLARNAKVSNGYRYLCLLALSGLINSIWTTNFDGLVAKTAANAGNLDLIEAGIDTSERVLITPEQGKNLLVVQLHGDYRYEPLKNTSQELQEQNETFSSHLAITLRNTNLIVIGYSGRDHSIMKMLESAYSQTGKGRLYWCGYEAEQPEEAVQKLIEHAQANGRSAFYIPTRGFDDLMDRLSKLCLNEELLERFNKLQEWTIYKSRGDYRPQPFVIHDSNAIGFLKNNAFHLECPSQIYQFDVPDLIGQGGWLKLRETLKGHDICAGLDRKKVLAIGIHEDIRNVFGERLKSEIGFVPIDSRELSSVNNVVASIFYEAITTTLAKLRTLPSEKRGRKWLIWKPEEKIWRYEGKEYVFYEAVALHLRQYNNKMYLVVEPTVRIKERAENDTAEISINFLVNLIMSKRYNHVLDDLLSQWMRTLLPEGDFSFRYPNETSIFRFNISSEPVFAKLVSNNPRNIFTLPPPFQNKATQLGILCKEPPLIFSNRQGDGQIQSIHPLRGIVENRPYDYRANEDAFGREIRIGVISPERDARKLSHFLNSLKSKMSPKTEKEYLMDYPGFDVAYGLPLDLPLPHNNSWINLQELDVSLDAKQGAGELVRHLNTAVQTLNSTTSPNVIIIYIPTRWEQWTHYETKEGEEFDLHDVVKAYCIQKGIPSQFLREKTITNPYDPCRLAWWLSLALYVKSGRTPWILDTTDDETVFIGIGYSIKHNAPSEGRIVLGCSHIYNSAGLGLGYKLSKIDDPKFHRFDRQKNPYLSQEDARRIGEDAKQLFVASGRGLPKRVVIHKRTPFLWEEERGLLEGLLGIQQVDMIEITEEPVLKYINGKRIEQNQFMPDMFAVRRGTCIRVEDTKALLWVHGVTDAVPTSRYTRYYKGGRGVPTPLVIIRHRGTTPLGILAGEVLGLSKMNWNNFDMYSQIPATIETSNTIARIGTLLERFGVPRDYRLFI